MDTSTNATYKKWILYLLTKKTVKRLSGMF